MRRFIEKYINKIYIKRLGENEYNIKFDLSIKLSNNEKEYLEKLMVEKSNKLFYIRNNNIYLQFFYIEEILWNVLFDFRYNRVNKLGKMFLYKFDLDLVDIEVC